MKDNDNDESAGPAVAVVGQIPELISHAVLVTIADAWTHYPSGVPLPKVVDSDLIEQVLDLLAQEGLIQVTGDSVALTTSGYEALQQASRTDHRLPEFLHRRSLSVEHTSSSSLLLAILRAHFRLRSGHNGGASG
jgi:hypothetical protein